MYVCLCNGFTDRQVREAICSGACTVGRLYQSLGVTPQCGKCVPYVRDMLRRSAGAAAPLAGSCAKSSDA